MQKQFRKAHRLVSLAFVVFWIIQALSGAFLVFHGEIDDLANSGPTRPLEADALGQSLERLTEAHPDALVTSVFLTSRLGSHYDAAVEDETTGTTQIIRLNGAGDVLLQRQLDAPVLQGGLYMAANRLHRSLLAGEVGAWIVGISGFLLLTNLLLGLKLACPPRGSGRKPCSQSGPGQRRQIFTACIVR